MLNFSAHDNTVYILLFFTFMAAVLHILPT